jgi:hypothetical protein
MTAIPPTLPDPQTDRPSSAVVLVGHAGAVVNTIAAKLVALLGLAIFAHLTFLETKSVTPSNVRLGLVAVPACVCLAMLCTDLLTATIKQVGGAVSPYLGKFGGKA